MPNRNVLITGSTSGIGSFLARHYAAREWSLFLHGRDDVKLKQLGRRIGPQATLLRANLGILSEIPQMFESVRAKTSSLDLLINNAFGKLEDPLLRCTPEAMSEFFQVSLTATAEVIRQSTPFLKRSDAPHIINIVADWGFPMHNVMTGPAVYVAAKYGIHGLGVALQTELDVPITNICPGVVAADTGFGTSMKRFRKSHGEKAIHPADIAAAIDFVLVAQSSQIRSIVLSPKTPKYNGL
jgi:NADP-dependent 3-hydroxy acid dehydrogenase YdfG